MKIGNNDINKVKIGSTDINKVYIGSEQVWTNEVPSLLLDNLSGSTGAFSLRKLSSSYNGSAIQVRRASDNTTQDIGFVNNQLDTASLNTFCSGTDGFVTIWYNQSDTSNNLIQTTSSNQPKIYDSINGVELENSIPCLKFNNNEFLIVDNSNFASLSTLKTIINVNKSKSTSVMALMAKGYFDSGEYMFYSFTKSGVTRHRYGIDGSYFFDLNNPTIYNVYSLTMFTFVNGLNGLKYFNNGQLHKEYDILSNLNSNTNDKLVVGKSITYNTWYFTGSMQEILLFSNDQTSNKTTIEDNINTNYSIY